MFSAAQFFDENMVLRNVAIGGCRIALGTLQEVSLHSYLFSHGAPLTATNAIPGGTPPSLMTIGLPVQATSLMLKKLSSACLAIWVVDPGIIVLPDLRCSVQLLPGLAQSDADQLQALLVLLALPGGRQSIEALQAAHLHEGRPTTSPMRWKSEHGLVPWSSHLPHGSLGWWHWARRSGAHLG